MVSLLLGVQCVDFLLVNLQGNFFTIDRFRADQIPEFGVCSDGFIGLLNVSFSLVKIW